ncbi:MAG TPA: helix-turn-helix transcriptional regulator [Propionibacteriaceae bacterium]|nr:helix-turn-helix transcriptional regulator [Propionibacteriaceae bacterium]
MTSDRALGLNATAAALLGLLRDGVATGYELARRAQEELGEFWTVTRSQVYRELTAMSASGLVAPKELGPRDRRPYELTDAGRDAFSIWLHQEPGGDVVRIALLLRLAFVDSLAPSRLATFAQSQREQHAQRLERYRRQERAAVEEGASDRDLVTLRFGLRYEQAALEWFDHDVSRILE